MDKKAKPSAIQGRKLGQIKPQTPSGKVKQWQPPSKGTSPADRKRDS